MKSKKTETKTEPTTKPPKLLSGYKMNFKTLLKAFENNDAALVSVIDKKTGKPGAVICAVQMEHGPDRTIIYRFVPLARLFDGDPYEEVYMDDSGEQPIKGAIVDASGV